jgi:NAD(P)-dependent dehydrogenase (short-subunit alcohol dehydrogenase family)
LASLLSAAGGAEFDGRVVAVTGGSSGIGLATALSVTGGGGRVALLGRTQPRLDAAVARLIGAGAGTDAILAMRGDAGDEDVVVGFVGAAVDQFGRLDGLAACTAAVAPFDLLGGPLAEWREMLDANLTHALIASRAAASALGSGGSIVLVGSMSAIRTGSTVSMPYAVAKGGIPILARGLAVALAPRGIRVNAVVPGWVDTPMSRGGFSGAADNEDDAVRMRGAVAGRIPLGRFAVPEEIGDFIAFVLSRRAGYLTGSELLVDGGELAAFGAAHERDRPDQ